MRALLPFVLLVLRCNAVKYYIAANGVDTNPGTSPTLAWASLDKLNTMWPSIATGDSISFRRGDVFRGQIEAAASKTRVTMDSFGDPASPRPVISGSLLVPSNAAWTDLGSGSFSLDLAAAFPGRRISTVFGLFVDKQRMLLARWPNRNSGDMRQSFVRVHSFPNALTLLSNDTRITHGSGYWNGASVVARISNWAYATATVSSYVRSGAMRNFTLVPPGFPSVNFPTGSGFYIENSLRAYDTRKEYFFDNVTNTLYLRTPTGAHPRNHVVEVSVFSLGLNSKGGTSLVFNELWFDQQGTTGVFVSNEWRDTVVANCTFTRQVIQGVWTNYMMIASTITRCTFDDILGRALYFNRGDSNFVTYNTITNIGMMEGLAQNQAGFGIATQRLTNTYFGHNTITNTGYNAIAPYDGDANVFDSNVISFPMVMLNDGAGFYMSDKPTRTVLVNNVIRDSWGGGYYSAPPNSQQSIGVGIYLDRGSHDTLIMNNTVYNCGRDVLKITAQNTTVVGNTFRGPGVLVNVGDGGGAPERIPRNMTFACNSFSQKGGGELFYIAKLTGPTFGRLNGNFYCFNRSSTSPMFQLAPNKYTDYLAWKSAVNDQNGMVCSDLSAVVEPLRLSCNWAQFVPAYFARWLPSSLET